MRSAWASWVAGLVLLAMAAASFPVQAADHRDGPIFGPPGITLTRSIRDINDVYVFRSPANANNTVFIVNVSPFSTATTPASFDQSLGYEIKIATTALINTSDDITFRATFGFPDSAGVQDVTLTKIPGGVVAQGKTGQNLSVSGGGLFRAGEQDDPFFFDASAFTGLLNGGPFPRPLGVATNFFGPNANTLSLVLEVPSSSIAPINNLIGVWARTEFKGVQMDRMGRPGINTALIPPVPRGSNFPIGQGGQSRQERRNAFNGGHPRDDRASFTSDMVSVLQDFYGRTQLDASALADILLPDLVIFQIGNPNGFGTFVTGPPEAGTFLGNGRRLRDDVIDFELTVLTNGALPTDNVPDDNGTRITDGNQGTTAAFPYIGARNASPTAVPGAPPRRTVGDYDGDGRADLAVFRPSTATWFSFGSTDGFPGPVAFGAPGDVPVPADFDGDGRTDLAVFRPSTATLFLFGTFTGLGAPIAFGAPGDILAPADFDGDRRVDLAVFRPSTAEWFIFGSSTGFPGPVAFGAPGDIPPVPGDYDGDGKADLAVFRPSTAEWFIFGSSTGFPGAIPFGAPGLGDVPVAADYDGDGKADLAVFRPFTGEWFIFASSIGVTSATPFGAPGDVPAPSDYDADGRVDLAVFRPSTAEWFVFGSSTGFPGPVTFGAPGDIPLIPPPGVQLFFR